MRSTWSSSCVTLSRPPVTSHLLFFNRVISITAPRLRNDLSPELRTIFFKSTTVIAITRHHLHPCSSSYPSPPGPSTQNLNVDYSKTPTPTHLIIYLPNLNDIHLNSYSVPSDPLEIGSYHGLPFGQPLWFVAASWITWCPGGAWLFEWPL